MKKALLVAIVVLSVLGAMAIPAWASRPEVFPLYWTGTEVLGDCGDFELMDDYVLEGQSLLFFDNEGDPVRIRLHLKSTDRFYNSETEKEFFGESNGVVMFLDLENDQWRFAGLQYHLNIPGVGVVLIDAGTVIFDPDGNIVFEAGKHQVEDGEFEEICAALADP